MSDSYKLTIMKDGQWREVGCFGSGSSENTPKVVDISKYNIEELPSEIIESLNPGDIAVSGGNAWRVDYKEDYDFSMVYNDSYTLEEVYYAKNGNTWVFDSFHNVSLDDSINSFTVATSGTITKAQADEYVKHICNGWLCKDASDSINSDGKVYKIVKYNTRAAYEEPPAVEEYLILESSYHGYNGTLYYKSIIYSVNADGNLDIRVWNN